MRNMLENHCILSFDKYTIDKSRNEFRLLYILSRTTSVFLDWIKRHTEMKIRPQDIGILNWTDKSSCLKKISHFDVIEQKNCQKS